tara:strand:+ start:798 stop:1826 length:1029 start_codon:yes stop_codon:yes gene_type:complete
MTIYNNQIFGDSHCTYQDTATSGSSGVYFIQYQDHPSDKNLTLIWNNDIIAFSGNNLSDNQFAGVTNNVPNPWVASYSSSSAPQLGGNEYYFQPTRLVSTSTSGSYTYYNYAFKWCHPRVLPYYRNTLQIDDDGSDSDFNDFIIYILPESDAYFVSPDDYLSSATSGAPSTVVRDGVGSNPPTYNIDWGSGSIQGAPTMSGFSGFGIRINKPQTLSIRFSRDANFCIRTIFFKPDNVNGGTPVDLAAAFYTYDGKVENFSSAVNQGTWGGVDESHTWSLFLQKGLGTNNESCTGSGNATCDQCNAYGVEAIDGVFKWTSAPNGARVRIRSTPPANIPSANFP